MKDLLQSVPYVSPITLGWVMLTLGVFLAGLARFIDTFRPRH